MEEGRGYWPAAGAIVMALSWGSLVVWLIVTAVGDTQGLPLWAVAVLAVLGVVGAVGCWVLLASLMRRGPWRVVKVGWYAERLQEDAPTVADLWPRSQQAYIESARTRRSSGRLRAESRATRMASGTPRRARVQAMSGAAPPAATGSVPDAAPGVATRATADAAPPVATRSTPDAPEPRTTVVVARTPTPAPVAAKAADWSPISVEAGPPTFSVSWWRPELVGDEIVRADAASFRSRTVVRAVVRNRHAESEFSAKVRILPWQARRDYPRQELPPPEFHVVPWEETRSERITISREITKKLELAWTFAEPHCFWFREPRDENGWILQPLSRSVRFELVVINELTGERVAKVCRIVFSHDSGLVEAFDVDDATP